MHIAPDLVVLSVTSLLTLLPMLFSSDYLVILASSLIVGLPIPTINSLLMGFVFAKCRARCRDVSGRRAACCR
mgnify:FL=1